MLGDEGRTKERQKKKASVFMEGRAVVANFLFAADSHGDSWPQFSVSVDLGQDLIIDIAQKFPGNSDSAALGSHQFENKWSGFQRKRWSVKRKEIISSSRLVLQQRSLECYGDRTQPGKASELCELLVKVWKKSFSGKGAGW